MYLKPLTNYNLIYRIGMRWRLIRTCITISKVIVVNYLSDFENDLKTVPLKVLLPDDLLLDVKFATGGV